MQSNKLQVVAKLCYQCIASIKLRSIHDATPATWPDLVHRPTCWCSTTAKLPLPCGASLAELYYSARTQLISRKNEESGHCTQERRRLAVHNCGGGTSAGGCAITIVKMGGDAAWNLSRA